MNGFARGIATLAIVLMAACGGGGTADVEPGAGGTTPPTPLPTPPVPSPTTFTVVCPNGETSTGSTESAARQGRPAPQILSVSPPTGTAAIEPAGLQTITVVADSLIDGSTLRASLTHAESIVPGTASLSLDGKSMVFSLSAGTTLGSYATYHFVVDAKDALGRAVRAESTFTTSLLAPCPRPKEWDGHACASRVLISTTPAVAIGDHHALALKRDGTLWAWGDNTFGQLGDGSTDKRLTPVYVGSRFVAMAAGYGHSLAVKDDGSLWAWGWNAAGQLGDRTSVDRSLPVRIAEGFASVAAGTDHSLGVRRAASLWNWGGSYDLGDGTPSEAWMPGKVGDGYKKASAAESANLAVKLDGTLWSWGSNHAGELGDGSTEARSTPVQIDSGFMDVAMAGGDFHLGLHSLALGADGRLWAWGQNQYGQVGDGTTETRTGPVLVGSGFASVAAGPYHSAATATDGSLWTWGWVKDGRTGDGSTEDIARLSPQKVAQGYTDVALGKHASIGIRTEAGRDVFMTWGSNVDGQLGDGTVPSQLRPIELSSGFQSVKAGDSTTGAFSAALKADGSLWEWGALGSTRGHASEILGHGFGQLSNGTGLLARRLDGSWQEFDVRFPLGGGRYVAVAHGDAQWIDYFHAVQEDGSLWSWKHALPRFGSPEYTSEPAKMGEGFKSVETATSGEEWYSLALKSNGELWAWGETHAFKTASDGAVYGPSFMLLERDIAATSVRESRALAVKTDGSLWTWGHTADWSPGNELPEAPGIPRKIGDGYLAVAVGCEHGFVIKADHSLWAWGMNTMGQLGNGAITGFEVFQEPEKIGDGFVKVSSGCYHALGLKSDGSVWAWGDNREGQIGVPSHVDRAVPMPVSGL